MYESIKMDMRRLRKRQKRKIKDSFCIQIRYNYH